MNEKTIININGDNVLLSHIKKAGFVHVDDINKILDEQFSESKAKTDDYAMDAITISRARINRIISGVIPIDELLLLVCESLDVTMEQIKSTLKRPDIVDARSLYIFFAKLENHDSESIIDGIGFRSTSAVPYHCKRVKDLVLIDKALKRSYEKCSQKIKSYRKAANSG